MYFTYLNNSVKLDIFLCVIPTALYFIEIFIIDDIES